MTLPETLFVTDVTQLLEEIDGGDGQAAEMLPPPAYDELRRPAAQRLAHEPPAQTLQATALVRDAFVRLVDDDRQQQWHSRGHFFAAAEAMRRILAENARRKKRIRHDGDFNRRELHDQSGPRDDRHLSLPEDAPPFMIEADSQP